MSTDQNDDLLRALGGFARKEQAAGTRLPSTATGDTRDGLPENVKSSLSVTARRSRDNVYAAALRGLDLKPQATLAKQAAFKWWKWALPSLALPAFGMAALLLWAGGRDAHLPVYSMEAHGTAAMRGDTTNQPFVIRPNTTVQVVLRPASNATPQIEVQLYWHKDTTLLRWSANVEISDSGSVLARGSGDVPWSNEEAHGELVAFVGPMGAVNNAPISDITAPPTNVQVLRQPVVWRP